MKQLSLLHRARRPIPRVDEVERVLVGHRYYVPTCLFPYHGKLLRWPTIGPLHEDAKWIGFFDLHYHIDGRFLPDSVWRWLGNWEGGIPEATVAVWPLANRGREHPPLTWLLRTCWREIAYAPPPRLGRPEPFPVLAAHFGGRRCKRSGGALICPHQGARLTMPADAGGTITCPLHGLRIDAKTGRVREFPKTEARA